MTKFFGTLFLINFAVGVVTGIVQEFQFGMNWSAYSRFVGDVFGAPLAMEGLLAFFAESTFLGLWIFGWGRLPPRVHLAMIWVAALGSNLSAYFILAANSWMQHPVGYRINPVTHRAQLTSIWKVLTNSTVLAALPHVFFAGLVTAGVFVVAASAWHGTVQGINNVQRAYEKKYGPGDYKPYIPVTYWSFRLMAGFGSLATLFSLAGLWLTRRRRIPRSRWFYRAAIAAVATPYLASTMGWIFTEMGRQPWTVFGVLQTSQSVSPGVSAWTVATSLAVFTLLYGGLGAVAGWLMIRSIKAGPPPEQPETPGTGTGEPVPVFTY
jgi:cytochrome bd-type quinol oxidase subunit 1